MLKNKHILFLRLTSLYVRSNHLKGVDTFMFNNISSKIKSSAKLTCIVNSIAIIVFCIIKMVEDEAPIYLAVIVFGVSTIWAVSMLIYGFGELVEKTSKIAHFINSGEKNIPVSNSDNKIINSVQSFISEKAPLISEKKQTKKNDKRINEIDKLRTQGLITEEEYQNAISKIQ